MNNRYWKNHAYDSQAHYALNQWHIYHEMLFNKKSYAIAVIKYMKWF